MTDPGSRRSDKQSDLTTLMRDLAAGGINRRDFIRRAVVFGASASLIATALAACGGAAPTATSAPALTATKAPATSSAPSAAASAAGAASAAPSAAVSTAPASVAPSAAASTAASAAPAGKRGGGGTLKLLQWQAPTILNFHLSSGVKDNLVCRVINEPLVAYDAKGQPVLVLAESMPSRENNLLAADGKSVTWKLKPGISWSDGKPFTADDVVFTWEYVADKATASTQLGLYEGVSKVEKVDERTVKFSFTETSPAWFRSAQALVLPKHIFEADKGVNARNSPNNLKPVGTGPYKVTDFKPGDTVTLVINETYREPNKPFFDRLDIKGGGDSASAARAAVQTGDYDYAWNIQVTDTVLKQLEQNGKGVAEFIPALGCERIALNFTDPNKEDPDTGERSSLKFPHPFLSDLKVRQALAFACDRTAIVQTLYGRGGEVGVDLLDEPPQFRSKNNTAEYSIDKANALLEEAGWKKGATGFRAKGDIQMTLLFQSSVNDVRQKTQQIVKDGWEKVGAKAELKSIDSAVFFSSDAGNPDTLNKLYADAELYASTYSIDPQSYMRNYHSKYVNQKANSWSLSNASRYQNPEYDKLFDQASIELDAAKRAQLFIQMNDIIVKNVVHIPLVARNSVIGRSKTLKGVNVSPYDTDYWNIADWTR